MEVNNTANVSFHDHEDASLDLTQLKPLVQHQFPNDMLAFTAVSAFLIAIFGTLGNLLTIFALPMSKKLRTTATAFVINLAIVELLFCVIILPVSGAHYVHLQYNKHFFSDQDCNIFTAVRYTLTQVEFQTIIAIALIRAIAVGFPRFYYKIDNKWFVGIYISLIWVYSLALKIPTFLGSFGRFVFNSKNMECDMAGDDDSKTARSIIIFVEAIIPIVVIIVLYIFLFVTIRLSSLRVARNRHKATKSSVKSTVHLSKSDGNSKDHSDRNTPFILKRMMTNSSLKVKMSINQSNRRDMHVARTIFVIFLMVLICTIPVVVVHKIDSESKQPKRFLAVHILYWLQYCLNVLVYVIMNRQYRLAYLELLSKVIPNCQRHRSFKFPWESNSITSHNVLNESNYNKNRTDSTDSSKPLKDNAYKSRDSAAHRLHGRLPAILENNPSSGVFQEEVHLVCSTSTESISKQNEQPSNERHLSDKIDEVDCLLDKKHEAETKDYNTNDENRP